jgi:small subunit ribosomal protein S3
MGHKVRPTSLRVGVTRGWASRWYADKKHFARYLVEDARVRRFIAKNCRYAAISEVGIERTDDSVHVILHTARPGVVIGRRGIEVDRLRGRLEEVTGRSVKITIQEVTRPELSAALLGQSIAEQLEKRAPFRRTMRRVTEMAREMGALGVKVQLAGRLAGSEMARREKVIEGSIPLHTLDADVDFGFTQAMTQYGNIGIKVWVYKGMIKKEAPAHGSDAEAGKVS